MKHAKKRTAKNLLASASLLLALGLLFALPASAQNIGGDAPANMIDSTQPREDPPSAENEPEAPPKEGPELPETPGDEPGTPGGGEGEKEPPEETEEEEEPALPLDPPAEQPEEEPETTPGGADDAFAIDETSPRAAVPNEKAAAAGRVATLDGIQPAALVIDPALGYLVSTRDELDEALLAARSNPGSTITLTQDITLSLSGIELAGITATLQGINGATIYTSGSTTYRHLNITNGSDITLRNLTLDGDGAVGGVFVHNSSFTMLDGAKITNCVAREPDVYSGGSLVVTFTNEGGGVHLYGASTMLLDGGEITGNTAHHGGGVSVKDTSTFTMNSGLVANNTVVQNPNATGSSGYGGGVYVKGGGATFNMQGGTISGNASYARGGGVSVYGGNAALTGGIIEQNEAVYGGGMQTYEGTVTINGTRIQTNRALTGTGFGGGIYCDEGSKITLQSGVITGNTGQTGAGVYVLFSAFIMNGGEISYNESPAYGGGIVVYGYSFGYQQTTLNLNGGEIKYNAASSGGGGLYIYASAQVSLQNVSFTGNITNFYGGGIYSARGAVTLPNSVTFTGNQGRDGGAIHLAATSGTFTNNAVFVDNKATYGASVYVKGAARLQDGGTHTGGTATYGGAVYVIDTASAAFDGATFTSNTATTYGGGVYVGSGASASFKDGSFTGNTSTNEAGGAIYIAGISPTNRAARYAAVPVDGTSFSANAGGGKEQLLDERDQTLKTIHSTNVQNVAGGSVPGFPWLYNHHDINAASLFLEVEYYNGDDLIQTESADYYGSYTVLTDAEAGASLPGYTFQGWQVAGINGLASASGGETLTMADHTYTMGNTIAFHAKWDAVALHYYDGANLLRSDWGPQNSARTVRSAESLGLAKTGYEFHGWSRLADGSDNVRLTGGETETLATTDVNLYAQWKTLYPVTLDLNTGATDGSDITTAWVAEGDLVPDPDTQDREGYEFLGWFDASDALWLFDTDPMPGAPLTLTAGWKIREYTLTWKLQNGGADITDTLDFGAPIPVQPDPVRSGYTFKGWYTAASGGTKYSFIQNPNMPASHLTLYAQWTLVPTTTPPPSSSSAPTTTTPTTTSTPPPTTTSEEPPPPTTSEEPGGGGGGEETTSTGSTTSTRPPVSTTSASGTSASSGSAPSASQGSSAPQSGSVPTSTPADASRDASAGGPNGTGNGSGNGAGEYHVNDDGSVTYTAPDGTEVTLPEGTYTILADGRVLDHNPESPNYVQDSGTVGLFGNEVPLGGLASTGGWGLFNLILGVLALLSTALQAVRLLAQRRSRTLAKIVAAITGVLPLLLFLIAENKTQMLLFSRFTPFILALFALHLAAFAFAALAPKRRGKQQQEAEAEQ